MKMRFAAIVCLAVLGLSLGGCSKCGFFWDTGSRACRADAPK
ncbi:MAG: peptidylprolyl isomerase [Hyphomicrobiales bacterium]|nr:peptidylprolyl isomerase [Hyphomicrobiales bacterium]